MSTRNLNIEPVALMGLTQREIIIVLSGSFAIMLPLGIVLGIFAGAHFGLLVGMLVGVCGGLVLALLSGMWVQRRKKDSPANFLMQEVLVKFNRARWKLPLGSYYYKRTKGGHDGLR